MRNSTKPNRAYAQETFDTLVELDEHAVLLDYKADYDLPGMLAARCTSVLDVIRFVQRHFRDVRYLPNPLRGHGGCSTFNSRTPSGEVLMGRNFDFKEARCAVVWTHPKDGYASMAVADQDFMFYRDVRKSNRRLRLMVSPYACMDGVNEKGLACAILELIAKPTKQKTGKPPITTNIALRAMLDMCATVDEAVSLLEQYDMHDLLGACYHYQIVDAQGNSAIVEYAANVMHVYRQEEPDERMQLTNFYLTPDAKAKREMGRNRYQSIQCALHDSPTMTEEEAMRLLADSRLYYRSPIKAFMVGTLWSAVYNCTRKTMLLSLWRNYSKQFHLSLDAPCKAVLSNEGFEVEDVVRKNV